MRIRYTELTDNELLFLMRNNKEEAFTEIYNRYWERLTAIGYYHTKSKSQAEEIVNDVLMGLWLRKKKLDIKSLPAYLGTAVKFSLFKVISREKRRNEIRAMQEFPEQHNDTTERLDAIFLQEYLDQIVEHLPEKARLVFKYSREQELSIKEIAKKMELSPKAVEYHMTKALKVLKGSMDKFNRFLFPSPLWRSGFRFFI
ncbi:sigma-70 family RNA polymerase sigma factor [Pedobacter nutrimenti]|uniref:RNA polymerase sigma-70 factor (ECF subfamily) n=1 Tax=Pedobacter nutrimenti TaxID=1241337 RepID=A0A318U6L7_9SPHI|nr:sigma-70 family RNA polymerase sigma factor [Pedobacter nutrimenti]PYF68995.1 RNA polymerase sigma-70 factor (ECF subfamily) [Pedobacter nutrimenti]